MDTHCLAGKHIQAYPSLSNLGYQSLAAGELTIILQNSEDPSCLICLLSSLLDVFKLTFSQRRLPPRLCIHLGLHHKSFYSWYPNKWCGNPPHISPTKSKLQPCLHSSAPTQQRQAPGWASPLAPGKGLGLSKHKGQCKGKIFSCRSGRHKEISMSVLFNCVMRL